MQSCSPIASASAAARRLRPFQLLLPGPIAASASTAAPRLPPLPAAAPRLRLLACRLRPLQLLLPIASASAAIPRLRPLQLLLPDGAASTAACPITFASTAALLLHLLDSCPRTDARTHAMFSNILRGVRGSVNKLKYEGRASL